EQNRGPDDGVERDVVLADEVVLTAGRVFPPALPRPRVALLLGPLDGRGQVAATRLEPDINASVVPARSNLRRQWHAPRQVARDGSRLQAAFQEVDREAVHVRP